MNIKYLNNLYLIIFIGLLFSFSQSSTPIYFESYMNLGYDSNPLRLSSNEIDYSQDSNLLLNGANQISSSVLSFYSKFSYHPKIINNRKTKFALSMKVNEYFDHKAKSNTSINFNISQSLGNYESLLFNYYLKPDFYLREYRDTDIIVNNFLDIADSLQSAYFSIEKVKIGYQFPLRNKKEKMKMELINEKQYYDPNFTEFDLDISGLSVTYTRPNFLLSISNVKAENSTYLDGFFSTRYMDRGYRQSQLKISYKWNFEHKKELRLFSDIYNRKYSSSIYNDNLHRTRKHIDASYSLSYLFYNQGLKNKLTFTYRKRKTDSDFNWVADLKTFQRYHLTYSVYFKKQKINI